MSAVNYYDQVKGAEDANVFLDTSDPLELFKEKLADCSLCDNHELKCFGHGVYNPLVMFIGVEPSEYDADSRIFSDKVGQKIQGIISYLSKELPMDNNFYATNSVICVNGDRKMCRINVLQEIELINPRNIILLGDIWGLPRLQKCIKELDKFYPVFTTRSLKELFYKRDEVKLEVKEDLDFFIRYHD